MAGRKPDRFPEFIVPLALVNVGLDRCPVAREQAETRILIMRVGAFGDILMGTPLLAALRKRYPTAHITWIAEHTERQAIDANPYVDEVLIWNSRFWKRKLRHGNFPRWLTNALKLRAELHRRNYDIFISLQPEEWPLLAAHSGADVKIGVFDTFARYYGKPYQGRNPRLYSHAYQQAQLPDHRADQYFLTLDALGIAKSDVSRQMTFGYTDEDRESADAYLREQNISGPFAVLVPFTTWPTKCWPEDRWRDVADRLMEDGYNIVLSGSPKEKDGVEAMAARMRHRPHTAAGRFTFRGLGALIDRAALVMSGDTGPMHAAAALGTPFLALWGPTAPRWYGPQAGRGLNVWHPVPCGPCDQKVCPLPGDQNMQCMRLITPEQVLAASLELLPSRAVS